MSSTPHQSNVDPSGTTGQYHVPHADNTVLDQNTLHRPQVADFTPPTPQVISHSRMTQPINTPSSPYPAQPARPPGPRKPQPVQQTSVRRVIPTVIPPTVAPHVQQPPQQPAPPLTPYNVTLSLPQPTTSNILQPALQPVAPPVPYHSVPSTPQSATPSALRPAQQQAILPTSHHDAPFVSQPVASSTAQQTPRPLVRTSRVPHSKVGRSAPYDRAEGPLPLANQTAEVEPDDLPRKRPCPPSQPNPSGQRNQPKTPSCAQVLNHSITPRAGTSNDKAAINEALVAATRQLAQPRDAPTHSQSALSGLASGEPPVQEQVSNMGMYGADPVEEMMEGLQAANDEVMNALYDERGSNSNNQTLYKLIDRMMRKQDAMYKAVQGIKQSRRAMGDHHSNTTRNNIPSGSCPNATSDNRTPPQTSPRRPPEPMNWDQSVPSRQPAGRQPRVARNIFISEVIRDHFNKLLKRKTRGDPLPPPPPLEIRYPTAENFGIRYAEYQASLFNRMAAKVVAEQVCANWVDTQPLTESEIDTLPSKASEHIRYLCRTWKDLHRQDAENFRKTQLLKASAASRRATLYESRLKVIDRFPGTLNMHRNLIIRLGIAGTSSDEEDSQRKGTFLIKRRPELSSKVVILKSKLDLVYKLYLKGPGSKGSAMHIREPSGMTLAKEEREFYEFVGHNYDYRFPDQLLQRNTGRDPREMEESGDEMEEYIE